MKAPDVSNRTRLQVEQTVEPFSALSSWWLLVPLAPVGLTILTIASAYLITRGQDPGFPAQFPLLVYAISNIVILGVLYNHVRGEVWQASAPFQTGSSTEIAAGIGATVLGVVIGWSLTTFVSELIGVARYTVPSLTASGPIVILFFGSVVVAPVAEEILYRGVFFGIVLERGHAPVVAGGTSLLVFAGVHVFTAGVGGVVNAFLLGLLLTILRLRFDNLLGAWVMHMCNNLLEFLVAVSVLPSLYAV